MPGSAIGVTTWIKQVLLGGVPFNRIGCRGQGNKDKGMLVGRIVDGLFKDYCKTGKIPEGKAWARKRLAYIAAALKQRGVKPIDANVFVKRGGLKTHMDGIAMRHGAKCVLELKTTQATLANHRAAYDVACSTKPTITVAGETVPNTERTHHQLQLAFGVLTSNATTGMVIVSASDGAAIYPLQAGTPPHTFDYVPPTSDVKPKKSTATKGKRRAAKKKKPPKWPGASVAAAGWNDVKILKSGVAVLTKGGKFAVATAALRSSEKPPVALLTEAADEVGATVRLFATPSGKSWRCYRIAKKYIGHNRKGARR